MNLKNCNSVKSLSDRELMEAILFNQVVIHRELILSNLKPNEDGEKEPPSPYDTIIDLIGKNQSFSERLKEVLENTNQTEIE